MTHVYSVFFMNYLKYYMDKITTIFFYGNRIGNLTAHIISLLFSFMYFIVPFQLIISSGFKMTSFQKSVLYSEEFSKGIRHSYTPLNRNQVLKHWLRIF